MNHGKHGNPGLLTRGEVSRLLGVSTRTLSTWEQAGKIPPPSRDWRGWRGYTRDQLEAIRARLGSSGRPAPELSQPEILRTPERLSARNHLRGVVSRIEIEGLMAEVTLRLGDGQETVAVITRRSVESLDLREGDEAFALIKSTEVIIGR